MMALQVIGTILLCIGMAIFIWTEWIEWREGKKND